MKVTDGKLSKRSALQKAHLKTPSQDLNNSSSHSNFYVTKLITQNNIKNQSLINENLPNLKINIQNIFSNEDKKEKIFQFLIKKNKDRNENMSKDSKKTLKTPDIKQFKKLEKKRIRPYNNNTENPIKTSYDLSKSCNDIRGMNNLSSSNKNMEVRNSGVTQLIQDDESSNKNGIYKPNNFYENSNNTYTNLLTNNKRIYVNRNKGNKFEHISIYNTYNNTFNNFRMQKNRDNKSPTNQMYDSNSSYNLNKSMNKKEKNSLEKNPYKDYMKNSNLSNIKKNFLYNKNKKYLNNISDAESIKYNNDNNIQNNDDYINNDKTNYYLKRVKNEKNKILQNNPINSKKYLLTTTNTNMDVKNKNIYYKHKNPRYKQLNQRKIITDDINLDSNKYITNENNKVYEKRNNFYRFYGSKDIRVNTSDNVKNSPIHTKNYERDTKAIENDIDNESSNLNTMRINIDKSLKKEFYNSPLSSIRFHKYFYNNNNTKKNTNYYYNNNKKIYEKRDPYQRLFRPNLVDNQIDNNYNNEDNSNKDNLMINIDNNNSVRKKIVFNDDDEIIEYIKKKYNKRNVNEILNRENSYDALDEPKREKDKYNRLMTTEEGNKIKLKNEELSTEIKQLIFENKQYKRELNDMKNKFNSLSKEVKTIKDNK